jgi:2-polyprenyl-6-methoxyphenol hydroxylase-like FAD-dependent oxidoreductase
MKNEVLIVGAGLTGLVLAIGLAKQGIPFRIIDKNKGPGEASRAMAVQARTLEFYRQFGFAEQVVQKGIKSVNMKFYRNTKMKAKVSFENMGKGQSPYPFMLSFPQDEHEKFLIEKLEEYGLNVEWNTELVSFHQTDDHVNVVIRKNGVEEKNVYSYLCGCDGAHSSVRKGLNLNFPGGTYKQIFYVADVQTPNLENIGFQMRLFADGFVIIMPIRTAGTLRLIGIIPEDLMQEKNLESDFSLIEPHIKKNMELKITNVNWYSTYKVHHRVSEHFRKGRVFIAGDAGHLHSPAGGQGMNTGIGDAVNLSWKLGAVIQRRADESILDSYEQERIEFAKTLVATTDRVFTSIVGNSVVNKFNRQYLIPVIIPKMTKYSIVRQKMFKVISQIRINYRNSKLSKGNVGKIHGGDRLPWIPFDDTDNFASLESFDWQLHVYGDATPDLRNFAEENNLLLHTFPFTQWVKKAGIKFGSAFLIRPDGYIALADETQNITSIKEYLRRNKLKI